MSKRDKRKPIHASSLKLASVVYSIVSRDGEMEYLSFDGTKQEYVGPSVSVGVRTYEVPYKLTPRNLSLATGPGRDQTAKQLFEQARNLLSRAMALPDERLTTLLAQYVLSTYVFDLYPNVSYLIPHGPPGAGKSRLNTTAYYLCFNTLYVNGSMSDAALFRYTDKIKGTLAIDESQRSYTDIGSDRHKMLAEGFGVHGSVSRCESDPRTGATEPRDYSVFGPKIMASRTPEHEDAIASRSVSIKLRPPKQAKLLSVVDVEGDEWQQAAAQFRNDALLYRQKRLLKLVGAPGVECSDLTESFSPRQSQVSKWLLDEAPSREVQTAIIAVSKASWEADKKEKSQSTDGMIAQAFKLLLEQAQGGERRVPFLSVTATVKSWGYAHVTPKTVGKFCAALEIEKVRANLGVCAVVPGLEWFQQRCEEHGLGFADASPASPTSPFAEGELGATRRLGEIKVEIASGKKLSKA